MPRDLATSFFVIFRRFRPGMRLVHSIDSFHYASILESTSHNPAFHVKINNQASQRTIVDHSADRETADRANLRHSAGSGRETFHAEQTNRWCGSCEGLRAPMPGSGIFYIDGSFFYRPSILIPVRGEAFFLRAHRYWPTVTYVWLKSGRSLQEKRIA